MAWRAHVNQIPSAAGPLPAADREVRRVAQASATQPQQDRRGPALVTNPGGTAGDGARRSRGEAEGTWERVRTTRFGYGSGEGQHQMGRLIFGILRRARGGTAAAQGCGRSSSPHPTGDAHGI